MVNIAPHNAKLKTFIRDLKPVVEMEPDALIMSNPGSLCWCAEHFPEIAPSTFRCRRNAGELGDGEILWQQMGLTA
ncbi:hypothetical protein ACVXG9_27695 [Escherichia coli]